MSYKWSLVYLNILTQSIAITDIMFNFGNFLTTKHYNFWSKSDRKKKKISRQHEILLRIQCRHKKCQNRKKKNIFFSKYFQQNSHFFKKYLFLENTRYIFRFWRSLSSFYGGSYLYYLGLIIKLWINNSQHRVEFTKNYENHVNFIFWDPPYGQIMTPIQKYFFSPHGVKLFFGKKPPTHNNVHVVPKWKKKKGQKIEGGGGF